MEIPKPEVVRARIEARRFADGQALMRACLDAVDDMRDDEVASATVPRGTSSKTRDAVMAALRGAGWEVSLRSGDVYDHLDEIKIALPPSAARVEQVKKQRLLTELLRRADEWAAPTGDDRGRSDPHDDPLRNAVWAARRAGVIGSVWQTIVTEVQR